MDPARESEAALLRLTQGASGNPVRLADDYRRAVEQVESLPQNQAGADKTWVERCLREYRAHYSRASRLR